MFAGSCLLLPVSTNFITLVPKPRRKEGHAVREPSLLRGIAVLRRSGSRKKRRPPVAARGGGAGAMEEQVGRKARCRAPGFRHQCNEVSRYGKKETGNRRTFKDFNNKINKHKLFTPPASLRSHPTRHNIFKM